MLYILDSNSFRNAELLKKLKAKQKDLFINSIIELEQYFYHLLKKSIPLWNRIYLELKLQTVSITQSDAHLAALYAQNFVKHPKGAGYFFRDCLIGATVTRLNAILITSNVKDFTYLQEEQVVSPSMFLSR